MDKEGLLIRTAFLATKEKLKDRILHTGKVSRNEAGSSAFFFYLIEILSPWTNSCHVFESIIETMEEAELSFDPEECYGVFEDSLIKINRSLGALAEKGEVEWIGNLNAVIGLVAFDDIHISQAGTITGYVFRKGKISSITEKPSPSAAETPAHTFTDVISGKIARDDRLVFGNIELFNHASLDRLRTLVEAKDANNAAYELFKSFRKSRLVSVNAAFLQASDARQDNEDSPDDETYYLDEPITGALSGSLKKLKPVGIIIAGKSKEAGQLAQKHSRELTKNARTRWQKKYGPETKAILKRAQAALEPVVENAKDKLGIKPLLKSASLKNNSKLKVTPYSKKAVGRAGELPQIVLIVAAKLQTALKPGNRKYLCIILIALFLMVGYSKVRENNLARNERSQARQIIDQFDDAKEAYETASQNLALGKSTASAELNEALKLAQTAQGHEATKDKADKLISRIEDELDKLTKTTRIAAGTLPNIIFPAPITVSVLAGSELYGVTADGKIFSSDTREREARLVASIGKDNGQAVSATYAKSGEKIYIYTNKNKVLAYDIASKTFNELKIVEDGGEWESAKTILSYVTNLYLLDPDSGQVWKHVERDGGYAKGKIYLETDQAGIKGSVSAAIDGDIFVLQNNGSVAKFIKGSFDSSFSLKDIPQPNDKIESAEAIYTDADSNAIFILDKKINRILKFNKSGDFLGQYVLEGFTIDSFVLNSRLQKVWLISGQKVFEVSV